MKKIFLSIALVAITFATAQKKEISAAVKAIDNGDTATANAQVAAAEALIGTKTYLVEPSLLEQLYYAKGLSLVKAGKVAEGAAVLAKMSDLGKEKIYTGKDADKNKVYFVGKAAADASGIQGLKQETYSPSLISKIGNTINPLIDAANKAAIDAYNGKNYGNAAPKFNEVYNLLKAAGQDNKKLLYYAGLNYALADKKPEAIAIYNDLINTGYTGSDISYTARNSKTGEVETLDKITWTAYQKSSDSGYNDFKTVTEKSVEAELYETAAGLMIENGQYDDALTMIDKGLKKFPTNARLSELQGTAYFKSGKTNDFVTNLKAQIQKNPNDANNWYNLGVLLMKDEATKAEAIAAYKKATELQPSLLLAHQNLTYTVMGDDAKAIDDYNAARKAGKMDEANKIMDARRKRFAEALPYAEKWYQNDPNNIEVVSLLKGLYNSGKNEAKVKEFKAKEDAMKAAGK